MKKLFFILLFLLTGCHRKSHYHIWGVSEGIVGKTELQDLQVMKENPNYWDCQLNDYGVAGCKECVDEWASGDWPNPLVIVAPEFCEPESQHGG